MMTDRWMDDGWMMDDGRVDDVCITPHRKHDLSLGAKLLTWEIASALSAMRNLVQQNFRRRV